MNKIINIEKVLFNDEVLNAVNSREFHEYLKIDTEYPKWIQRAIEKYDFMENDDFVIVKNDGLGNKKRNDYITTLDMAKELCMVSNTQKGKEVRRYFIQVEKEARRPLTINEQIAIIAQGSQKTNKRLEILEKTKRLEGWQEKALHDSKNKKVYEIANDDKALANKLHRKVWSLFKKEFHLPRYNELPAIKFDEGKSFIHSLSLADMV